MFLMYVDESGDVGMINSPTRYFVLTGIVVHELRWKEYIEQLITFRRHINTRYGIKVREEIHASAFINNPGELVRVKRHDRLAVLREFADLLASLPDLNVINVVVDKRGKAVDYDPFEMGWKALIQRFENTIARRNFRGPANADERGLLIPDATDDKKLTTLIRRMHRYNPIPNKASHGTGTRNLVLQSIIEDPFLKNSSNSLFIQAADLAAYLLYQSLDPNNYMKKKSGHRYFERLEPILCKVASTTDSMGIVRL
jgi:hypothetical protein